MDLTYTTQLSNGQTVSIIEDGENIKVEHEDVSKYYKLVLKTRLEEGRKKI